MSGGFSMGPRMVNWKKYERKLRLLQMGRKGAEREFLSLSVGRLPHFDRV